MLLYVSMLLFSCVKPCQPCILLLLVQQLFTKSTITDTVKAPQ